MSKQLLLSASLSIVMMVGFVLSGVDFNAPQVAPAIGSIDVIKVGI